jgi:hypothetical protein
MKRLWLLWLLWKLDEEAFDWLVLALLPSAQLKGAHTQVWPDGLGGFRDRETLDKIRAAAAEYIR